VSRMAGPIVSWSAPSAGEAWSGVGSVQPESLPAQRSPENPAPDNPTSQPTVQTAVEAPESSAALAAPPDQAGAAATGGKGMSADDLDQLAGRLYDKIRHRLSAELRLDRERAGVAAGLRR
ncbi:MAG: hypothetical protein ACRDV9_09930, partial [Acidimicrobiia bacterium]